MSHVYFPHLFSNHHLPRTILTFLSFISYLICSCKFTSYIKKHIHLLVADLAPLMFELMLASLLKNIKTFIQASCTIGKITLN